MIQRTVIESHRTSIDQRLATGVGTLGSQYAAVLASRQRARWTAFPATANCRRRSSTRTAEVVADRRARVGRRPADHGAGPDGQASLTPAAETDARDDRQPARSDDPPRSRPCGLGGRGALIKPGEQADEDVDARPRDRATQLAARRREGRRCRARCRSAGRSGSAQRTRLPRRGAQRFGDIARPSRSTRSTSSTPTRARSACASRCLMGLLLMLIGAGAALAVRSLTHTLRGVRRRHPRRRLRPLRPAPARARKRRVLAVRRGLQRHVEPARAAHRRAGLRAAARAGVRAALRRRTGRDARRGRPARDRRRLGRAARARAGRAAARRRRGHRRARRAAAARRAGRGGRACWTRPCATARASRAAHCRRARP